MPLQISRAEAHGMMKRLEGLQGRLKGVREKTEKTVETVMRTMVTSATSGAFGFTDGRWGGMEVFGIPGALLASGLAHGVAFMGLAGVKGAPHLHAAGDGALANYTSNLGFSFGKVMAIRAKELNPKTGIRKGQPGFVAPTDEEIKAFVISGDSTGARLLSDAHMREMAGRA